MMCFCGNPKCRFGYVMWTYIALVFVAVAIMTYWGNHHG